MAQDLPEGYRNHAQRYPRERVTMDGHERNYRTSASDRSDCRWIGESMVWILLLLAMKMHKQSGILILFGVTKATQDDQIRKLKRLHFEANFLNGDSPRDVRQKLAEMKGQLWAIGSGMLQNHLVQEVLGKSALTGKTLSRLVDEAHTIKEGGPSWRPDILKLCEIRDILGPSSARGLFSAIMSR